MTKDEILEILKKGATKKKDKSSEYRLGNSSGKMEAYSHAWTLVKNLSN